MGKITVSNDDAVYSIQKVLLNLLYVRGWEISQTQQEWTTTAAALLERSYGVLDVSYIY